jgi:hypothetical protein
MSTRRLTVGQALVEFFAHQWTVDRDLCERTISGILGIFGYGNLAGLGQALRAGQRPSPDAAALPPGCARRGPWLISPTSLVLPPGSMRNFLESGAFGYKDPEPTGVSVGAQGTRWDKKERVCRAESVEPRF